MRRFLAVLSIFFICLNAYSQKYVSVVEAFCNTGNSGSNLLLPEVSQYTAIADTSDLNELIIQYHVPQSNPDWEDAYVSSFAETQWLMYQNLELTDTLCAVIKNGEQGDPEEWYNCAPENKYIYSLAKKVTVLFKDAVPSEQLVEVEVALYTTYDSESNINVHVLALESGISVDVSGGVNAGQTFDLQNVVRAGEVFPADSYSTDVVLDLPDDCDLSNVKIVAFVQDHNTGAILGGTRGIFLQPYLDASGEMFSVVENFVNSGCFGGPPAINSMSNYVEIAENNNENQALVQLHIGQTYGNWSDIYKLPLNAFRYDKYAWDMGIIAGLAAVAKNGIRYKEHTWNNCAPLEKMATDYIDISLNSFEGENLVLDYVLSGDLSPHDRVYFYVVERDITVLVTGAEIPGTTLNMNNVARVARWKSVSSLQDTVLLQIPADVDIGKCRVLAYIQNDVTYEVTGGTKGFALSQYTSVATNGETGFAIYPNPLTSGSALNIKHRRLTDALRLQIIDANGVVLMTRRFETTADIVNVSDHGLQPGLYIVTLSDNNYSYFQKLIVH